ncbi:hypothetical protein N7463_002201 [Penicillium fimorum]|uniref:Uncharacterized protein n=1 Tax=Penicillium fimorum TaxID=1882269 RepID=A0A9W9XYM9_9EURO|nr:hypothetical protein N7463_002201 [Penicillium fimorum]
MATHQGPSRRNGVIGVNMTGHPAPAIPLIALDHNELIGFRMVPGSSHATSSLNNQGPPHRITPLVGPDTAHSSPFGQTNVRQTQRDICSANDKLADAEAVISRQEGKLNHANSQLSALRTQMANQRSTTRFVDQQQMDMMIYQSKNNRSRDVNSQFCILENRMDEISEELERAEGNRAALQKLQHTLDKDRGDVKQLQQIVAATEYSLRRQERLAGSEARMSGLLRNMERMQAAAMQNTRISQIQTRSAPIAESKTNPVGIARRPVMGSQELDTQGHAFDHHPPQLDKGKERGPRYLPPEERECDEDLISDSDESDLSSISPSDSLSNAMSRDGSPVSLDTHESSRAGSPMSITIEPKEQELAARMLQADESQMGDQMVQGAPNTTLTIAPQQVETYDMMQNKNQLSYFELAKLNGQDFDGYMDWEPTYAQTITSPNQEPDDSKDVCMLDVIPARRKLNSSIAFARRKHRNIFKGKADPWATFLIARDRDRKIKRQRLTGINRRSLTNDNWPSVGLRLTKTANLPSRKRRAVVAESSEDEEPSPKKRITKKTMEANSSLLLSSSEVYVMNTAPNVPEVSVSAVSQPAQSVHVSTEEVPTQTVMSEPAVSQPTQTISEDTESAKTEQVPIQAVMSEPAVFQPTQAVLEYTKTISTEQVPTAAAMSALAVPQPTQAALEATEQVPIDEALSEPAVSQPTQADSEENETVETVQVSDEAVTSEPAVPEPSKTALEVTLHDSSVLEYTMLASAVCIPSDEVVDAPAPSGSAPTEPLSTEEILSAPAVTEPTLNESDLTWQTEDELAVPSLRTGTRSHIDVLLTRRAAGTQARPTIVSSSEGLQVIAAPHIISTSSLVVGPEDASVKNAVATGIDSRAGVSKGTKRVEDAENSARSAQQSAGEQREEMDGEEAATTGFQMPGAWPSDPSAVTASDESDMQEGLALLRELWTGARRLSFGVFAMVMVILLSFPLWAGHLEHLVYALEGPEQFLEELRWDHGYDVPFLERIVFVFLRCFAGDRTLFG